MGVPVTAGSFVTYRGTLRDFWKSAVSFKNRHQKYWYNGAGEAIVENTLKHFRFACSQALSSRASALPNH